MGYITLGDDLATGDPLAPAVDAAKASILKAGKLMYQVTDLLSSQGDALASAQGAAWSDVPRDTMNNLAIVNGVKQAMEFEHEHMQTLADAAGVAPDASVMSSTQDISNQANALLSNWNWYSRGLFDDAGIASWYTSTFNDLTETFQAVMATIMPLATKAAAAGTMTVEAAEKLAEAAREVARKAAEYAKNAPPGGMFAAAGIGGLALIGILAWAIFGGNK